MSRANAANEERARATKVRLIEWFASSQLRAGRRSLRLVSGKDARRRKPFEAEEEEEEAKDKVAAIASGQCETNECAHYDFWRARACNTIRTRYE